jgi:hypothetical protein
MTPEEIHDSIARGGLYIFKTRNPLHVVKSSLRRHCKELNFPSAHTMKYFTMTSDSNFALLDSPVRMQSGLIKIASRTPGGLAKVVNIPTNNDEPDRDLCALEGPSHTEIQWRLLDLGSRIGMSVWAPHSDRGRGWSGKLVGNVPRLLSKLPLQFDKITMKTIENIDVLWLEGNGIMAGFEVEHSTQIYSGLLRMSDLMTMQPNIDIKLYLVAPDDRVGKFAREIARPTFALKRKPLHRLCRFIPYTSLLVRLEEAKNLVHHLKPEFLDDIADSYDPAVEVAE